MKHVELEQICKGQSDQPKIKKKIASTNPEANVNFNLLKICSQVNKSNLFSPKYSRPTNYNKSHNKLKRISMQKKQISKILGYTLKRPQICQTLHFPRENQYWHITILTAQM